MEGRAEHLLLLKVGEVVLVVERGSSVVEPLLELP